MNKNEILKDVSKIDFWQLLNLLKQDSKKGDKTDPEFCQTIISEIESRNLSDAEKKEFGQYMKSFLGDAEEDESDSKKKYLLDDEEKTDNENKKYSALKSVASSLSIFAYISIVIAIINSIKFALNEQVMDAITVFFGVLGLALILLAISNLIHVFIDIEFNTRKTKEVLQKKFGIE